MRDPWRVCRYRPPTLEPLEPRLLLDAWLWDPGEATPAAAPPLAGDEAAPSNSPPVANADALTIAEDSPAAYVDALANDSDPDPGDVLTIVAKTDGQHGTVAVLDGGLAVSYASEPDFQGVDTFTYTISDSQEAPGDPSLSLLTNLVLPSRPSYLRPDPAGRLLFVSLQDLDAIGCLDISDPEHPVLLSLLWNSTANDLDFPAGLRVLGTKLLVATRDGDAAHGNNKILTIVDIGGTLAQQTDAFVDCRAESQNGIVALEGLNRSGDFNATVDGQPDVPRNIRAKLIDANHSVTSMGVSVSGVDARGNPVSVEFSWPGAAVQYSGPAFASVTEVMVTGLAGGGPGDYLDVGIGSRLGLSRTIVTASDVYRLQVNGVDKTLSSSRVDAVNATVDVAGKGSGCGGAIAPDDDFDIYYRVREDWPGPGLPANPFMYIEQVISAPGIVGSHDVDVAGDVAICASYWSDSVTAVRLADGAVLDSLIDEVHLKGAHDVVVDGHYAYVAATLSSSITVVDISDPTNLSVVGYCADPLRLKSVHALSKQGDFVYAGSYSGSGYLNVIDVSDPTSPQRVGSVQDTTYLSGARGVWISGDCAFVCARQTGYVAAVDVGNPQAPAIADQLLLSTPDAEPPTLTCMCEGVGDRLYVTNTGDRRLEVLDISQFRSRVNTATGTVTVNVVNVNDDPKARDDAFVVLADAGAHALDVLANDSYLPDPPETLTISGTTGASHGTVVITDEGRGLTYTPDPGYVGGDSFSYTISDGNGGSGAAAVTVTVTLVMRTPGDANLDGTVDGGDYTIWSDHYNQPGDWQSGDFNGDDFVNGADYTVWADHYQGLPAGSAGAASLPVAEMRSADAQTPASPIEDPSSGATAGIGGPLSQDAPGATSKAPPPVVGDGLKLQAATSASEDAAVPAPASAPRFRQEPRGALRLSPRKRLLRRVDVLAEPDLTAGGESLPSPSEDSGGL